MGHRRQINRALQVVLAAMLSASGSACRSHPAQVSESISSPTLTPTAVAAVASSPIEPTQEDFTGAVKAIEKRRELPKPAILTTVRTSSHVQFDRIVFEFEGAELPGYRLEYTREPLQQCGSGESESLIGKGRFVARLTPAMAHTEAGVATVKERQLRPGLAVLKELKVICDAEGDVEWAIGLTETKPYRVLELTNPVRLVIDFKR